VTCLPTDPTDGPVHAPAYWGVRDAARQERVSGHVARDRERAATTGQGYEVRAITGGSRKAQVPLDLHIVKQDPQTCPDVIRRKELLDEIHHGDGRLRSEAILSTSKMTTSPPTSTPLPACIS
jgi:hypothetical protein